MEYTIFRPEDRYFVPTESCMFADDIGVMEYLATLGTGYHAEVAVGGGCRIISLPEVFE